MQIIQCKKLMKKNVCTTHSQNSTDGSIGVKWPKEQFATVLLKVMLLKLLFSDSSV